MDLETLCVEPIYHQYSGVLETCLALRYCFLRILAAKVLIRTDSSLSHRGGGGLNAFYWYQIFALDSAVYLGNKHPEFRKLGGASKFSVCLNGN